MKIIVCLKQVPKNDSVLRINEQETWIQDRDLTYEINESDAYALEEALQLKEKHGGEVVALSLGPQRVPIRNQRSSGAWSRSRPSSRGRGFRRSRCLWSRERDCSGREN
jgi:electron transfer flavoprotein beta subunit